MVWRTSRASRSPQGRQVSNPASCLRGATGVNMPCVMHTLQKQTILVASSCSTPDIVRTMCNRRAWYLGAGRCYETREPCSVLCHPLCESWQRQDCVGRASFRFFHYRLYYSLTELSSQARRQNIFFIRRGLSVVLTMSGIRGFCRTEHRKWLTALGKSGNLFYLVPFVRYFQLVKRNRLRQLWLESEKCKPLIYIYNIFKKKKKKKHLFACSVILEK